MSDQVRHFLITKRFGKLERVRVFDDATEALRAYEQEERECGLFERITPDDATCVLLGAARLATLLVTHSNWFDEPSQVDHLPGLVNFPAENLATPRPAHTTANQCLREDGD